MGDDDSLSFLKEIGGVLRLGSGLLGKSAIALGIWEAIIFAAVIRLHSDVAILIGVVLGALGFFVWFFPVLQFAKEHPAEALLEGSEWSGFQKFQASAKGYIPATAEQEAASPSGSDSTTTITVSRPKPPESEGHPNG